MHGRDGARIAAALLLAMAVWTETAVAELAVSANDQKVKLVDGAVRYASNPGPDNIVIFDVGPHGRVKTVAEVNTSTSVVGPPLSVAITPDESLALVTSAMKIDPQDTSRQVPDSTLAVVDLQSRPPAVIATLRSGNGAAGISINRQGTLALVANRNDGTVSVFSIAGKTVTLRDKVTLGDERIGVSHVAISPDGTVALATRDGDHRISVLSIDSGKVTYTKRDISAGLGPRSIDISPDGHIAVVANIGTGGGDADTASVIDLTAKPPRVIETFTVGQTPEGIKFSPDGDWLAVTAMNGSNKAPSSPFYHDHGALLLFRVTGTKLTKVAQAPVGRWPQGVAFSGNGKTILVSGMVEQEVSVYLWDGKHLKNTGKPLKVKGGSVAVRFADRPVPPAK